MYPRILLYPIIYPKIAKKDISNHFLEKKLWYFYLPIQYQFFVANIQKDCEFHLNFLNWQNENVFCVEGLRHWNDNSPPSLPSLQQLFLELIFVLFSYFRNYAIFRNRVIQTFFRAFFYSLSHCNWFKYIFPNL
jgi:hypothetical protein